MTTANIREVTADDIQVAMHESNGSRHVNRVLSVFRDDHETDAGIMVTSEDIVSLIVFMAALAEKTGHSIKDLTADGYLDNDEPDNDIEYYNHCVFPAVRFIEDTAGRAPGRAVFVPLSP